MHFPKLALGRYPVFDLLGKVDKKTITRLMFHLEALMQEQAAAIAAVGIYAMQCSD